MLDKSYWIQELDHPYSPSIGDFNIYKNNLINGSTLLLGCTHKLIQISDKQMDLDPWYDSPTVIVGDWINNKNFYDNIIGDGVLNFTKNLTDNIILMCSKHSLNFIARCFNYKLPKMKIADYFPKEEDFLIKPKDKISNEIYTFYFWKFKNEPN
jgi:hypothetical protein